jgi:glycosyltransferase involved in cell wall biosynthesis
MKVCLVTHSVLKGDGQGRVNYEVVLEAICRGHNVTILASSISPNLQQHPQITWVPISVKGLPTALLRELFFSYQTADWLRQHRHQFDVIKVNGAITSAPADINAVHFVHSSWLRSPAHTARQSRNFYGAYQWLYTWLNAHWEKQAFRRAKIIVAVSQKVKQELIEAGVPSNKIRVILNGADLEEFHCGQSDRSQWNLPEYLPLALFAGDIRSSRKNLNTVLQALIHVPTLHLVIAGAIEGSPYPELAATLGLSQRVHFLGHRHDLPELMRAVDCFVFPSRYEPFGMVVIEAMASGLPVVVATMAGVAELISPECGMVLMDAEDEVGLVEALKNLTDNADLRAQMGQAARQVAEQHPWSSKAESYLAIFEEFVKA